MSSIIPYHRPYPLNHGDKSKIHARLNDILFSGQLTNGKYVRELEDTVKEMYGVEYCIALSSCTQGLLACVRYLKYLYLITREIDLPSFTWKSLKNILKITELQGEWIDIDKETWLPGYTDEYSIGLHTFGNIMDRHATIYDGSHALGCKLKDIGMATVFSLAPTKLITSCEGGLVITNRQRLAEFVIEYRDKCARMSEIHAIIGLQTLTHLKEIKEWKEIVYHYYNSRIEGIFQKIPYNSNYNTIAFLNVNNLKIPAHIETKQYYEPLKKGLPNTDYVYSKIIAIPSWFGCPYEKIVEDINNGQ